MAQRSRLSPESTREEIRAARIEDARQVPSHRPSRTRRAHIERRFFEAVEVFEPFVGVTRVTQPCVSGVSRTRDRHR
jgi:hypothetical protein